jgi:hypothetical protein
MVVVERNGKSQCVHIRENAERVENIERIEKGVLHDDTVVYVTK